MSGACTLIRSIPVYVKELRRGFIAQILRNSIYSKVGLELYEFFKGQGSVVVNEAADFAGTNGCYLYQKISAKSMENGFCANWVRNFL